MSCDFNGHHVYWDTFERGDPNAAAMYFWLVDNSNKFDDFTLVRANANDLKIVRSVRNKDQSTEELRKAVDEVSDLSVIIKFFLNASNCMTAFFSLDSAESKGQPNIAISAVNAYVSINAIKAKQRFMLRLTSSNCHTQTQPKD